MVFHREGLDLQRTGPHCRFGKSFMNGPDIGCPWDRISVSLGRVANTMVSGLKPVANHILLQGGCEGTGFGEAL